MSKTVMTRNGEKLDVLTDTHLLQLYSAASSSSKSLYVQQRREQLITLTVFAGGRFEELPEFRISDVEVVSGKGSVRFWQRKSPGSFQYRDVEIPIEVANRMMHFIKGSYKDCLRMQENLGISTAPDYLFLNERTGERIKAIVLRREARALLRLAGFPSGTSTNIFRRTFRSKAITSLKASLPDRTDIATFIGQKNSDSLSAYISYIHQDLRK